MNQVQWVIRILLIFLCYSFISYLNWIQKTDSLKCSFSFSRMFCEAINVWKLGIPPEMDALKASERMRQSFQGKETFPGSLLYSPMLLSSVICCWKRFCTFCKDGRNRGRLPSARHRRHHPRIPSTVISVIRCHALVLLLLIIFLFCCWCSLPPPPNPVSITTSWDCVLFLTFGSCWEINYLSTFEMMVEEQHSFAIGLSFHHCFFFN